MSQERLQQARFPIAHELAKEQAKTDQAVTPEYLAWFESLYPARNGVGGNEAWNAGIAWLKAQQEQPASVDAYVGAREDAAIWKKRALEAEELNRKFIAELNGPTYLGEPVKQKQPAQKPDLWKTQFLTDVMTAAGLLRYGRTDKKLAQRIADGSARWRTELYTHPAPTQPAQKPDLWKTQC